MPDHLNKLGQRTLPRRDTATNPGATADPNRARKILAERRRRKVETLKVLTLTPKQKSVIECPSRVRLVLGANRVGKSSLMAIDAGMIVTGQHPIRKFPKGYEGRLYFVGKDATALAEVFYKKLFRRGEFVVIKDPETGQWRSFNPVTDKGREGQQAPPIIPARFVDHKASSFRRKAKQEPAKIVVKNYLGQIWELSFFTAEGDPQRGVNIDGAYFSEELQNDQWYTETVMRLTDRKGFLFVDAAQQEGADWLAILDQRADDEAGKPNPHVWKIRFSMYDNPFLDPDEIEIKKKELLSDDDVRVRIYGEPAAKKLRMFPEFIAVRCCFKRSWLPNKSTVPLDWTRYLSFDPGMERACVLMLAVPPPDFEFHPELLLCYDEVYVAGETVGQHVQHIETKCIGQSFKAFVFDDNEGAKRDKVTGVTLRSQYEQEMYRRNVRCEDTGCHLRPGFDNIRAGVELIRSHLMPATNGLPRLMFLEDTCPHTQDELRHLKRDKRKTKYHTIEWLDKPAAGQNDHGVDCLRYLLGLAPKWEKPKSRARSWADRRWESFQAWKRGERKSIVLGPKPRQETNA